MTIRSPQILKAVDMLLQHMELCHIGSFELRPLKNSKYKDKLSLNYMINDRSSKKNSIVINLFPGTFINQGWFITGEETRSPHTARQTLSQTTIPLIYSSKGQFIFPKIIYSLLRGLHSPLLSLLKQYLILNSKPPQGVTLFSPGLLPCIHEVHMLANFCLFSSC